MLNCILCTFNKVRAAKWRLVPQGLWSLEHHLWAISSCWRRQWRLGARDGDTSPVGSGGYLDDHSRILRWQQLTRRGIKTGDPTLEDIGPLNARKKTGSRGATLTISWLTPWGLIIAPSGSDVGGYPDDRLGLVELLSPYFADGVKSVAQNLGGWGPIQPRGWRVGCVA